MVKNLIIFIAFVVIYQSCSKEIVIYDSEISSNFELGLILEMNGKDCLFDSKTSTLKYSLAQANLINFSPKVKFQSYSSITFNGNELTNNSINNLGTIELHKKYPVKVTTLDETKSFNLIFTDIPLVQIVTRDKIPNEPKVLGKLILHQPELSVFKESWINIEIRGASSALKEKTSFGFNTIYDKRNLDLKPTQFFSMAVNSKWILDALYIDKSKVRNRTTTELWKEMNPTNAGIKSRFVEVFVNNEMIGLYSFNENYTESYLSLNNQSILISGIDNSETTKFEKIPTQPTNSSIWGDWEQKIPDPSTRLEWPEFQSFCELVISSSDQEFVSKIAAKLNLDNIIDYYLFVNVCNGYDNVGKNYFFLKRDASSKFEIVVWDLDATWGRDSEGGTKSSTQIISNALFDRLIELEPNGFKFKLKNRWNELRATTYSHANITSLFNSNVTELINYNSIDTENAIWNTATNLVSEQGYINNWTASRLIFLDSYFSNL